MNSQISFTEIICTKPFIVAIMIYYIFLYFIQRYVLDKIKWILLGVAFVSIVVYIFWFPYKYEVSSKGLYGITTYYRWIPYFAAMLMGAYIGTKRKELKYNGWLDFVKLMLCVTFFYAIQFAAKVYTPVAPYQVITLLPLIGIVIYAYKWCNNEWMKRLYQTTWGYAVIMIIGGLCLESYLIQGALFTNKMNGIWPLNIFAIVIIILCSSYIVRCFARLFLQTFRTEEYDWKNIFSLY